MKSSRTITRIDTSLGEKEEGVATLARLADELEQANVLYGAALDSLIPALEAGEKAIVGYDINAKMAEFETGLANELGKILEKDAATLTALDDELLADDREENELLADDGDEPQDPTL